MAGVSFDTNLWSAEKCFSRPVTCLTMKMGVEVPLKFCKGGQALRAMCTMLAFPFTWCPAESSALEGNTKDSRSQSWTLGGALGGSRCQAHLRNCRGLGCPGCSSSPNRRSRQDLRPSRKTSCPRSLAAARLTPLREENIRLQ